MFEKHFKKLVIIVCLVFLVLPRKGYGQTVENIQQKFKLARNAYTYGNYADAIRRFRQLLYPKPGQLHSPSLRREAHKYLGISYYYIAKRTQKKRYLQKAQQEFLSYLLLALDARFDPLLYPPDLVAFFDQIRRTHARRLAVLRKRKRKHRVHPLQILPLRLEYYTRTQHPLIAVLPLGIPQYVNGENLKGSLLLAGEVVFLGMNFTAYFAVYSYQIKQGNQRGRFRAEDINSVKRWQVVQFVSLGLFAGILAYGFIDGFIHFHREKTSLVPLKLPTLDPKKFGVYPPLENSSFSILVQ